jgi:hypothetical protein
MMRWNVFVAMGVFSMAVGLSAQNGPEAGSVAVAGGAMLGPKASMVAMSVNDMDAAPVKGAPFCATVVTDHSQAFADGNRIHTNENSTLCRDSEGRIRREAALNLLGAGSEKSAEKLITIVDPVAGARYVLDPVNKVAHKMPLAPPGSIVARPGGLPEKGEHVMIYRAEGAGGPQLFNSNVFFKKIGPGSNEPAAATEELGDQTVNGIRATGTRMTTTIPAGQMGNDKPIIVTSERWYSSDLKATVMTKHSDPWAGELKTELTSVNTSEPDPALFTVPSDYRVADDRNGQVRIQMAAPLPATLPATPPQ